LALFLFAGLARPVAAQDGLPRVTVVQSSADEYLNDMQYIVELAGAKGKAEWKKNLKPFFDFFTPGIDLTKPIRVDVFLDDETRVRLNVPIANLKNFLGNLKTFGIKNKPVPKGAKDFFELMLPPKAFLRLTNGYAVMSNLKTDVPAGLADPVMAIEDLLAKKYDVGAEAKNDAKGIKKRREAFHKFSRNLLDATKKKTGEDADDFEIRKLVLTQQLQVAERFFVESSQLVAGWTTDVPQKEGRFDIELVALGGTSLEEAIKLLGQTPSYFAHIKRSESAILSGRINFTLDKFYKDQLLALTKLVRPNAKKRIDSLENKSDEKKQSGKTAVELLLDLFEAGTKAGEVDGFVEVFQEKGGQHSLMGGIRVPHGNTPLDILKLLHKIDSNVKLELVVDQEGNVGIHKLTGLFKDDTDLKEFFGDDAAVFFAFDNQAVWFSIGKESLSKLKAAMQQVNQQDEQEGHQEGRLASVVEPTSEERIEKLIGDLDDDSFQTRESATVELMKLRTAAESLMRTILTQTKSLEVRYRIRLILETKVPKSTVQPKLDAPLVDVHVKVGPWIEFLDRRRKRLDKENADAKLTDKEKTAKQERENIRQMALSTFKQGGDTINLTLRRSGDQVDVKTIFGEGILRFVGSLMADFSAETL